MDISHAYGIHFSEVFEEEESLRYSLDKNFFLLKYTGDQPAFCFKITEDLIGLEEYTHEEILEVLATSKWTNQD